MRGLDGVNAVKQKYKDDVFWSNALDKLLALGKISEINRV